MLVLFSVSCNTNNKIMQTSNDIQKDFSPVFASGPSVLVYKTKANYNNLVPVILSDDKTEIVSYPHPSDITAGSGFPLPAVLKDGYLLDKRGIGKNAAFLKITYEEYSQLEVVPSTKELYNIIEDKDPLTELCNCGVKSAFTDQTKQLNQLISSKKLRTTCKTIL